MNKAPLTARPAVKAHLKDHNRSNLFAGRAIFSSFSSWLLEEEEAEEEAMEVEEEYDFLSLDAPGGGPKMSEMLKTGLGSGPHKGPWA